MSDGYHSKLIADDGVQHRVRKAGHAHLTHAVAHNDARLRAFASVCDCALDGINERSAK